MNAEDEVEEDFHEDVDIHDLGTNHGCEQCGQLINKGERAVYSRGVWNGEPYEYHTHPECIAAARACALETGCWGEDFPWFQHMDLDPEEKLWLLKKHPIVAKRLGIERMEDD